MELRMCEHEVCDFCSSHSPTWHYPARDAVLSPPGEPFPHQSIGGWLACDECHGLIERNEWTKLTRRALLNNPAARAIIAEQGEDARDAMYCVVAAAHQKFREARTGKAERYTPQ